MSIESLTTAAREHSRLGALALGPGLSALAVVLVWWRSGPRLLPYLDSFIADAQTWPDTVLSADQTFILFSPLGQVTYQVLGAGGKYAYLAEHAAAAVVGFVLILVVLCRAAGPASGWRAWRLVVLAPLGAVLVSWIGSYDAFTLAAWALLLWLWSIAGRWGLLAGGFLVGLQNFEQGMVGLTAVTLVWWVFREDATGLRLAANPAWAIIGVAAGRLALQAFFLMRGVDAGGGRLEWLRPDLVVENLTSTLRALPLYVFSVVGGLWLLLWFVLARVTGRRDRVLVACAGAIPFLAGAIAVDHTRVFTISTIPMLVLLVAVYLQRETDPGRRRLTEAAAWLTVPIVLWGNEVWSLGLHNSLSPL
jgi:hypothetical protein